MALVGGTGRRATTEVAMVDTMSGGWVGGNVAVGQRFGGRVILHFK